MGKVIAVAGKGGTGKTTISALIIRYLYQKGYTPILAVDADPSTNLHLLLGMEINKTIGEIREEAKNSRPFGQSLSEFLDYQIQMALVEGEGIDLLAMGRCEGKGCYCAANANLRESLKRLSSNYRYTVIDNEAGIEHISRQTDGKVDIMFFVSDPSPRGIRAASYSQRLIDEIENEVKVSYLILNRVEKEPPDSLLKMIKTEGLNLLGVLHSDQRLINLDMEGASIFRLAEDSCLWQELKEILESIGF